MRILRSAGSMMKLTSEEIQYFNGCYHRGYWHGLRDGVLVTVCTINLLVLLMLMHHAGML